MTSWQSFVFLFAFVCMIDFANSECTDILKKIFNNDTIMRDSLINKTTIVQPADPKNMLACSLYLMPGNDFAHGVVSYCLWKKDNKELCNGASNTSDQVSLFYIACLIRPFVNYTENAPVCDNYDVIQEMHLKFLNSLSPDTATLTPTTTLAPTTQPQSTTQTTTAMSTKASSAAALAVAATKTSPSTTTLATTTIKTPTSTTTLPTTTIKTPTSTTTLATTTIKTPTSTAPLTNTVTKAPISTTTLTNTTTKAPRSTTTLPTTTIKTTTSTATLTDTTTTAPTSTATLTDTTTTAPTSTTTLTNTTTTAPTSTTTLTDTAVKSTRSTAATQAQQTATANAAHTDSPNGTEYARAVQEAKQNTLTAALIISLFLNAVMLLALVWCRKSQNKWRGTQANYIQENEHTMEDLPTFVEGDRGEDSHFMQAADDHNLANSEKRESPTTNGIY